MSASIKPTFAPSFASATARFTATVLLPTPPFPLATAIVFLTPGRIADFLSLLCERTREVSLISIFSADGISFLIASTQSD